MTIKYLVLLTLLCAAFGVELTRGNEEPLAAPRPKKDPEASRHHLEGRGLFVIYVDKPSGEVATVTVEKSTGQALLDASVVKTLMTWRFKPKTVFQIAIPVAFTADNDDAFYPVEGRQFTH